MKENIEDQYWELIQEYNKLPNACRYGIDCNESIRLTLEAERNPFVTVGYAWLSGFLSGIRYAKNQQKRNKSV